MIDEATRARTLEKFEAHRRAWDGNAALRETYAEIYARLARELPAPALGAQVEIGAGPGLSRDFMPALVRTDLVRAPWHDDEVDAHALPFADASLGALVLFDVLHHIPQPRRFFAEAARVLRPGGRIVMCEPFVSPLSFPVYRFFHEEPLDMRADPLADQATGGGARDPFLSNQAIPTLLFGRDLGLEAFRREFPSLVVRRLEHLTGPSYAASGGFSRRPLLPMPVWRLLHRFETLLPGPLFRVIGFRILVVLERAPAIS